LKPKAYLGTRYDRIWSNRQSRGIDKKIFTEFCVTRADKSRQEYQTTMSVSACSSSSPAAATQQVQSASAKPAKSASTQSSQTQDSVQISPEAKAAMKANAGDVDHDGDSH
jgi:hypothetical protein